MFPIREQSGWSSPFQGTKPKKGGAGSEDENRETRKSESES